MLEIKDLSVRYGKQAPTIEHFNLNMKKGEIISVVAVSFPFLLRIQGGRYRLQPGRRIP